MTIKASAVRGSALLLSQNKLLKSETIDISFRKEVNRMNNRNNAVRRTMPFPVIGNRIIKTAAAVFLCLMIHMIRGFQGGAAESCITAIICMQPYAKEVRKSALDRLEGTCMGAFWGLLFLLAVSRFPVRSQELSLHMLIIYLLITLGVIASVYSCVVLNIADSAALTAIVFLCLVIDYPKVEFSLTETFLRILDTVIGVLAATLVNSFAFPTRKRRDRIFFLKLTHLAEDRYSHISPRVLTELNRLYDSGAKICLETEYAPAFLISQLQMLHINMPVIVLGGAALYDIRENVYQDVQEISHIGAYYLQKLVEAMGGCGLFFTVRGNSMMLFQAGEINKKEAEDYSRMRRSPYRNYVKGLFSEEDRILAFRMILDEEKADAVEKRMRQDRIIARYFQLVRIPRPKHSGEVLLYFYRSGVTIGDTEKRLLEYEKEREKKTFIPVQVQPSGRHYKADRDAVLLLHRIRRLYQEPFWVKKHG